MPKTRRVVEYAGRAPRGKGGKLWGYGYADVSKMLGVPEGTLRARVSRGTFNPGDMEALFTEWARVRGLIAVLALALAAALAGCGEITAQDMPDAGDAGGIGGAIAQPGTGGAPAGTGGRPAGVGGAPGTGGSAPAYPFCEPTETLTVDTASCQKLQPGGTYKNGMRDGYVCALCDPASTGMAVKNFPCIYSGHLCTYACESCN